MICSKGTSGRGPSPGSGGGEPFKWPEFDYAQISSLSGYQGSDYININEFLRGKRDRLAENYQQEVKALDSMMVPAPKDMTVYRSMGESAGEDILEAGLGGVFRDKGFVSTSLDKGTGRLFRLSGWHAKIEVPKGSKILNVQKAYDVRGNTNPFKSEQEVLLSRGTKFTVKSYDPEEKMVHLVALK